MRGGMVSTPGLARGTETPRHRQGRTSACPCELGVDRSPVLIGPIVASEGNGGRLGNYADPTAARFAGRYAPLVGQRSRPRTRPTSCPHAFPQRQPRFIWPGPDHPGPRTSTCAPRTCAQVMATTTLVAPEYAYPVTGNSDALYDLREPEPSQSFALIASSAAGYTRVPLVSTCAPGVSFAGSTLPLPMMCMTGTPCAKR